MTIETRIASKKFLSVNRNCLFCRYIIGLVLLVFPLLSISAVYNATPLNYTTFFSVLKPGDTLELQGGIYESGLTLTELNGAPGMPITITGPRSGTVAEITGRICCNTVQIENSSYLVIQNIQLNGKNIDGIDGVNGRGITHHITIQNFNIIGHGGGQQTNGISTKGPAWDWIIRDNVIIRAGTGMYLGNSEGDQPFVKGIIENNLIVDTIGYNMQIKHQLFRSATVGFPSGNHKTLIRHNVFTKGANSSGGSLARPNLLVGHFPLTGIGQDDLYEIYGNFFFQNPSEALFQGEGNIAFYNNIMRNDFGDAINIQRHNDVPRFVSVFNNTVVASNSGIRVVNAAVGYQQSVIANAVFSASAIIAPLVQSNISDTYAMAGSYLNNPLLDIASIDFFPKAGQLTGPVVDINAFLSFTEGGIDFNGDSRSGVFRGAYAGEGTNTGWQPSLNIMNNYSGTGPSDPRPELSFNVTPNSIETGGFVKAIWTTMGADTCQASGNPLWSGSKPENNAAGENIGPLFQDTTFILSCSGKGGDTQRTAMVNVQAQDNTAPTIESISVGLNGGEIYVKFSEPLSQMSAVDTGNYSINNGITINTASLGLDQKTVTLTVNGVSADILYTLMVSNIFDVATIPNEIIAASSIKFTFTPVVSTGDLTPNNYEWDTLAVGTALYIDRDYITTNVPSEMFGFKYLRTGNDDKNDSNLSFITFSLADPSIVYIAYDRRNTNLPDWMRQNNWQDSNQSIESTDVGAVMRVYQKQIPAGVVSLGGNEFGNSMYLVMVGPKPSNPTTTDPIVSDSENQADAGSLNAVLILLLLLSIIRVRFKNIRSRYLNR